MTVTIKQYGKALQAVGVIQGCAVTIQDAGAADAIMEAANNLVEILEALLQEEIT